MKADFGQREYTGLAPSTRGEARSMPAPGPFCRIGVLSRPDVAIP